MDRAGSRMKYFGFPPSLSELAAEANAVSGWHLLQREGVDWGDGSLECA